MKKGRIHQFIQVIGQHITKDGDKWVQTQCPLAFKNHSAGVDKNPSFGISVANPSRYHCFSCGASGDIMDLIHEMREGGVAFPYADAIKLAATELDDEIELDIDDYETPPKEAITPWPESFLDKYPKVGGCKTARDYLIKRGVHSPEAKKADLRYDTAKDRLCVPIRDFDGRLMGMHGRDLTGKHPAKYLSYGNKDQRNPDVWLGEHWLDPMEPIVFVESVFDVLAVLPLYSNVCAPMGASLNKGKLDRMASAVSVFTLFDGDTAGNRAASEVRRQLPCAVRNIALPEGKDPGELTRSQLGMLLSKARVLEVYTQTD